jgi:hypothetical protein
MWYCRECDRWNTDAMTTCHAGHAKPQYAPVACQPSPKRRQLPGRKRGPGGPVGLAGWSATPPEPGPRKDGEFFKSTLKPKG